MKQEIKNDGLSYDTKTIITVLALVFVYPVGLIFMFLWMKWSWWVKLSCLLIFILPLLIVLSVLLGTAILVSVNPKEQIAKAKMQKMKSDSEFVITAINSYYVETGKTPWNVDFKKEYKSDDIESELWLMELVKSGYLAPSFKLNNEVKYSLNVETRLNNIEICFDSLINKGQKVCVPKNLE